MSNEAQQTPLLDLLRAVPSDARAEYEHSQFHHSMIPYGRLCADAAQTIAERDAEIERLKKELRDALGAESTNARNAASYCVQLSKAKDELTAERQRARMPDIPSEKVLSAISESLFNASFLHGSSDVPTDIYEAILSAMGLDNG